MLCGPHIDLLLLRFSLRNIGVETSDIESEDERESAKQSKKKKSRKKKTKKAASIKNSRRSFRINPFSSSSDTAHRPPTQPQDRFSSGSHEYELDCRDGAPKLPKRGDSALGIPPRRSSIDHLSESDDQSGHSPAPVRQSIGLKRSLRDASPKAPESPNCSFPFSNRSLPRDSSFKKIANQEMDAQISPSQIGHRKKKINHVTTAFGVLAMQPVKLARQPVKLAKYTTKKVRDGVDRVRKSGRESSEDDELDLEPNYDRPPLSPGVYHPSEYKNKCGVSTRASCEDSFSGRMDISSRSDNFDEEGRTHFFAYGNASTTMDAVVPRSPDTQDAGARYRSGLMHVTNAIGVLARQPIKLAKQPVRLAKYTTNRVRKRVDRTRNQKCSDDDDDEDSLDGIDPASPSILSLPPPPFSFDSSFSIQESDDDRGCSMTKKSDFVSISSSSPNAVGVVMEMASGDEEIDNLDHSDTSVIQQERSRRRSSLQHMTNAIGSVAKQPYKLAKYTAKQPIKLAVYTGNSIRKRIKRKYDGDSMISDAEKQIVSEDESILDYDDSLAVLDSPCKEKVPPFKKTPQTLLFPMSDCNSSTELSVTLGDFATTKSSENPIVDLRDHTIYVDDLEQVCADEDIMDKELCPDHGTMEFVGNERDKGRIVECSDSLSIDVQDDEKENSCNRRKQSYRISMTGDVFPSDELTADNLLVDYNANADHDDSNFQVKT